MKEKGKVVVAVMTPRFMDTRALWVEQWMVQATEDWAVLYPPMWADHSGRVDVAFSSGFAMAKAVQKESGVPTWYLRFDDDCGKPLLQSDCPAHKRQDFCLQRKATIGEVMDLVKDCNDRGWDVALGLTLDEGGNPIVQVHDSQIEGINETEPFTVDGGGHGFCAVSPRVLEKLPLLAETTGQGGVNIELYTEQNRHETEDAVFNRHCRENGFKVCEDPRLNWGHRKARYLYRQSDNLSRWKEALLSRPQVEVKG